MKHATFPAAAIIESGFAAALNAMSDRQRADLDLARLSLTNRERETLTGVIANGTTATQVAGAPVSVEVYDRADAQRLKDRLPPEWEYEPGGPPDTRTQHEIAQSRAVDSILSNKAGATRTLHTASYANLLSFVALTHKLTHFRQLAEILANAIRLSAVTGSALQIPPILLNGGPGVGKSWFARRIGEAIGLRPEILSMATNSDISTLTGLSPAWKGARIGRIATDILFGASASPFYVLDEIDKLRGHSDENPHNILLTLLEPETSHRFRDELLDLPFDARHVYWVMTSNERTMPAPLLDRMLVVDIPALDQATKIAIAYDLYEQANRNQQNAFDAASDDVLATIARMGLRDAQRAILFAMGIAARADRLHLLPDDIRMSHQMLEAGRDQPSKIGFTASLSR